MDVVTKLEKSTLTPVQRRAAYLLASGLTQDEVAQKVGRAKWAVNYWVRSNPAVRAEMESLLAESWQRSLKWPPQLTDPALNALNRRCGPCPTLAWRWRGSWSKGNSCTPEALAFDAKGGA